jgi:hypothetical protein
LHKQVDVVRLDGQFDNRPALFGAFLPKPFAALGCDCPGENSLAPFGSPDQVIDNQVKAMLVALILQRYVAVIR